MTLRLHLAEATAGPPRALTPAQVATLATVPGLVTITPTGGGLWRLAGRQRVGIVRLGHGDGAIEMRVRPKLPVRRLLGLLGHDDVWRHRQITAATDDLLVPALATVFARAAERVLRGGVLHGYVYREDALTVVRGRIRTSAQLSRRMGLPTAIEVAYDDYLADIPENQILLGAIELAQTLPDVADATLAMLRHLSARLVGVVPVHPGAPLPPWRPTRLNERYVPALRLAELLLSGASLQQEGSRAIQIDGFILNMPQIFERFLTRQLTTVLLPYGLRCVAQQGHRLDQQRRVLFQPDILVCRDGRPEVVVDAKYRTLDGAPPTGHLFQLISYCIALGLTDGHLVYASGTPSAEPYQIKNSDIRVHVHVLDLDQEPADLENAVAALLGRLTERS
ncbi:5-methylcytosine-specific restriction enzyme subunit McrC [Streptosporangium album]|uniref:5-methylcytosine-specific restriction enzyme subunit McrC n=1 Tax=Streptosporangium album TaxID=47479 RepID=A0A7W7W963_9ACTN|nr:restriction endonuclease [Streptosporangium album]MBB4937740.1 5-methylcytosine-specific restriction enzyme subunit McrC [Streptosporangium album]